jgi:site-specific DNA-methyltransferase (adenine-specific)
MLFLDIQKRGIILIKKELIELNISDIIPYENNPMNHEKESVEAIVKSMDECSDLEPIEIDENNLILAGHGRRLAHLKRGDSKAMCIRYTGLSEEQKIKYRILSNKTHEYGTWNADKLAEELEKVDLSSFDFSTEIEKLNATEAEPEEDNFDEEPPEEPKVKRGDIYQLGEHRLMCGDSTNESDVLQLIGTAGSIDLAVTDPPYNVDYAAKNKMLNKATGGNRMEKNIENDKKTDAEFKTFLTAAFNNLKVALKMGGRSTYGTLPQFKSNLKNA